jgi:NADH:ubiquinone oxidoreductase subunit 3 (subunit A)
MPNRLIPLAILIVVVIVIAVVGFIAYSIIQEVSNKTKTKMEKRNVMFTKDGMKVGVREVKEEEYVDRSQRYSWDPPSSLCRYWTDW